MALSRVGGLILAAGLWAAAGAAFAQAPVVLQGDYGYRPILRSFPDGATIDARGATWRLSNSRNAAPTPRRTCKVGDRPTNPYPLRIQGARGGMLLGGRILGEVPVASARSETYCNSAGLFVQSADFTVRGMRIDQAWDGIRTRPPQGAAVRLDGVWVNGARDDCIENDGLTALTVTDSLLDGCFMGLSLDPGACKDCRAPRGASYSLDGVLMRLRPYPTEPREVKSGIFLKTAAATPRAIEITNSVFAFEDIAPRMYVRMARGWDKVGRCANNRLLYLGGSALPKDFPRPPACFTVVTGEQARREWEGARRAWLARRPGL